MSEEPAATPAWIQCLDCDLYWCTIHNEHASDCACPEIDEWGDVDPYQEGGRPCIVEP